MNKKIWYALWGVLFVICAGLGFVAEPEGGLRGLMIALSVAFFVPPMVLLRTGAMQKKWGDIRLIRNLSLLSLASTVAVLVLNFMSLTWSEAVGNALYSLLVVISTPMVCSRYWLLSLFLWACVLMGSLKALKRK